MNPFVLPAILCPGRTWDTAVTAGTPIPILNLEVALRWEPLSRKVEGGFLTPGRSYQDTKPAPSSYLLSSLIREDKISKINYCLMASVTKSQNEFLALELGRFTGHCTSTWALKQISDQYCLLQGFDSTLTVHSIWTCSSVFWACLFSLQLW